MKICGLFRDSRDRWEKEGVQRHGGGGRGQRRLLTVHRKIKGVSCWSQTISLMFGTVIVAAIAVAYRKKKSIEKMLIDILKQLTGVEGEVHISVLCACVLSV